MSKKEIITIHNEGGATVTDREVSCEGREGEEDIIINTSFVYNEKNTLVKSSIGIKIDRKLVYSNTNWFKNEKLVRTKQNGILREIAQGETPCEIEVSKPRCILIESYFDGLYPLSRTDILNDLSLVWSDPKSCVIETLDSNAKSAIFLLNPEHPITLEQKLLIDPYDAIKYYWYPHCKIYGEQFIEKDGEGLFWRKHSRLFSPYWNKTELNPTHLIPLLPAYYEVE